MLKIFKVHFENEALKFMKSSRALYLKNNFFNKILIRILI